jgi:hypothetical protein
LGSGYLKVSLKPFAKALKQKALKTVLLFWSMV